MNYEQWMPFKPYYLGGIVVIHIWFEMRKYIGLRNGSIFSIGNPVIIFQMWCYTYMFS